MYIPIILGTAREGRQSENVATYLLDQVKKNGIDSAILDVRDFRMDATDNSNTSVLSKRYKEHIERADALIIVTPEYNHGYPGELKMMLDMLYMQYRKKPVGFAGVSSGIFGGARAVEQLRLLMINFWMVPIREALHFPNVGTLFDEEGTIKEHVYDSRVKRFLDELKEFMYKDDKKTKTEGVK